MRRDELPIDMNEAKKIAAMNLAEIVGKPSIAPPQEHPLKAAGIQSGLQIWDEKIREGKLFFHQFPYPHLWLSENKPLRTDILNLSQCFSCKGISIWVYNKLVYPLSGRSDAPPANPDMPTDIRRDYDEAASILELSPRGAATLLRLAVEKLCEKIEPKGESLNDKIGNLVKQGLSPEIQQALDVLRVIGNSAAHAGKIDIEDDKETALGLFRYLNLIVDRMVSEPKHLKQASETLPEGVREQIKKRDGKDG